MRAVSPTKSHLSHDATPVCSGSCSCKSLESVLEVDFMSARPITARSGCALIISHLTPLEIPASALHRSVPPLETLKSLNINCPLLSRLLWMKDRWALFGLLREPRRFHNQAGSDFLHLWPGSRCHAAEQLGVLCQCRRLLPGPRSSSLHCRLGSGPPVFPEEKKARSAELALRINYHHARKSIEGFIGYEKQQVNIKGERVWACAGQQPLMLDKNRFLGPEWGDWGHNYQAKY